MDLILDVQQLVSKIWRHWELTPIDYHGTPCRCALNLSHFCFMITLCLINSFSLFIASSRLSSSSDPTLHRVSQTASPCRPCGITKNFRLFRASMGNSQLFGWRTHGDHQWRYFLETSVLTVSKNFRGLLSFLFTAGNKFSSYYNKLRHL